ncbi:MAG: hypothetical protein JW760_01830 [Spirochaetales bacterium]|nr:hypothetical protein [Spirochaetales bacterium]
MEDDLKTKASSEPGFFEKIITLLFSRNDPEKEKRKLLKEIAKELKKQKYKFYNPKGGEALPGMARFFYDIYKVIGPAQVFLEHAEQSGAIKTILIESFLTPAQSKVLENLSEDAIRQRLMSSDIKRLSGEIKEELVNFFSGFNGTKVQQVEEAYNLLSVFLRFINFDYYFVLRKFDSGFPERDFLYNPAFEAINGDYITDDLMDFLELLPMMQKKADWGTLFTILKEYKNVEVVNRDQWKKILKQMSDVYNSGILELIVRHLSENPDYRAGAGFPNQKIVEEYLTKIKTQTELVVQKLLKEKKTKKIEELCNQVFGSMAISRTKYYTEKSNMMFSKKMLGGYTHIEPLNYLKAFLLDHLKKDIREIVDFLLIRGKWSTTLMSQQLSESFYALMRVADEIVAFDESLADEGERGSVIKSSLQKAEKNAASMKILRQSLKEANDTALRHIEQSVQHLVSIGKSLKYALEDAAKQPPELIINWKELQSASDGQVRRQITEVYKQIYYFVQLMQYFAPKKEQ